MTYENMLGLFVAGALAGILNSLAGGGSLISFPALIAAGLPPITASATNSFSATAGYIAGAAALRSHLLRAKKTVLMVLPVALLGGWLGSEVLISLGNELFASAVPWLLLIALVLFALGPRISALIDGGALANNPVAAHWRILRITLGIAVLCTVCVYGGFFNAGLGLMLLACLSIIGMQSTHSMNGLKLTLSAAVSATAVTRLWLENLIAPAEGLTVMAGTIIGGYCAAHLSQFISEKALRGTVLVIGSVIVAIFLYGRYG